MGMNVFVLCTPRSSSYTFAKACTYISNYRVAHESNSGLLGKKRVVYPENHIEVDNRLAWFLGYLDELYGDNAFYVHLIRNKQKTAISINKRWNLPASIINAYGRAILVRGDSQLENDLEVCEDYYETVTKNIQLFLKDKSHKIVFKVENAQENFREFWQKIGAKGNLELALETWDRKHNASPKNQDSIQVRKMKEKALVEISNVSFGANFPEFIQQEFRGCNIDSLKKGDRLNTYFLPIIGWVLGQKYQVVTVEVVSEGIVVETVPVNILRPGVSKQFPEIPAAKNSGFSIRVGLLGLPMASELTLQAVLENGSRFPLGNIKFRRLQGLKSWYSPKIQPLAISSIGPSGAEQLLQLLVGHPSLVGISESTNDTPPSYYWLKLLAELSSENGIFDASTQRNLRSKEQRFKLSNLSFWREQTYPENLGSFCLESIDGFYSNVQAEASEITYFVERYDISRPKFLNLLSELYPEGKEIILVRDFRDVVYSMLPFSGRKCAGFDSKKFKSYQQFVYHFGKYSVGSLLARWKERSPHIYFVKYEDLILSPEPTLRGILEYLSVNISQEVINTMLKKITKNNSKPEALLGDWQYEMPASLQVLCSEVCEAALQEFGYS